jgi:hypothetical protein
VGSNGRIAGLGRKSVIAKRGAECSIRDLRDALSLLRVGGTLVEHDCDPPDRQHAIPHDVPGGWCGVMYKAFLDFVIRSHAVEYFTVDTACRHAT